MSTRPPAAGPPNAATLSQSARPRPRLFLLCFCRAALLLVALPLSALIFCPSSPLACSLLASSNDSPFCALGYHRSGGAPKSPAPCSVCACVSSWHRLHRHSKLLCVSAKCGARKRGVLWCTCSAGEYRPRRLHRWHSLCCNSRAAAAARCHIYVR